MTERVAFYLIGAVLGIILGLIIYLIIEIRYLVSILDTMWMKGYKNE